MFDANGGKCSTPMEASVTTEPVFDLGAVNDVLSADNNGGILNCDE